MINTLSTIIKDYHTFKEATLSGRYINATHISEPLRNLTSKFELEVLGKSTLGEPIHSIKLGSGKLKILMWSQMHGNESTTTKAVFDLLNVFKDQFNDPVVNDILSSCTLFIIPMLNPDGARAYTRVNANEIDLNRDAKNLTQVESKILRKMFNDIQPDFCLNLHDQRTIFSAGNVKSPATLSFLTPSEDNERSLTPSREESMKVITAIYKDLSKLIPKRIGRYDDGYNANCTGDAFQSMGVPTILFEAGHSKEDYDREKTREYVFYALFSALNAIATQCYKKMNTSVYFNIPENEKLFYDLILRNAVIEGETVDVAIQYKEILNREEVKFLPIVENISAELAFFAHKEIQCNFQNLSLSDNKPLIENVIVDKILLNDEVLMIN
ncbi:zinc carboxypeptidase [Gillisia mitskevichiae]|uniref:Zinc carboxypeptidase n=1 Tax=Gillisia mitskevichiae TaxID=270921 RepID=A0A495PSR7_9FLAO|nr:M14 family zinc carboxypeptidase [Gillisia mitskevichiae]RKS53237.1 zinc carboxypeptidase [Gillisia mitskevichiae]